MGLIILCLMLVGLLIWDEIRFQKIENKVNTLTEKTSEILKAYYEEIDYLKDTLTDIRGENA